MLVQTHSDKNVSVHDEDIAKMVLDTEAALARYDQHLTRVEIHFRDESAGRPTDSDIRCLIEARPRGQQPVVVTDSADTPPAAFVGALAKMGTLLESKFDRLDSIGSRMTIRGK